MYSIRKCTSEENDNNQKGWIIDDTKKNECTANKMCKNCNNY